MVTREPFAPDEWYHCYSRGVEGRRVFESLRDYQRFQEALYLCNDVQPMHRYVSRARGHNDVFSLQRKSNIVSIGAYCLMPNHFHLLIKEIDGGGITHFMRKMGTAYTMYFNTSRERIGNLFVKPFRSKHVGDDEYFKRVAHYIHLNPAELFERDWKRGDVVNAVALERKLAEYAHSSLPDYLNARRAQKAIISEEALDLLATEHQNLTTIIDEAREYYADLPR